MASISRVKERAEEQSSAMSVDQQATAGVSVELVRSARHHGGDGNWGDLLIPVIVTHQSHS